MLFRSGRPSIGSVVAKLKGPTDPSVPCNVALADKTRHSPWSNYSSPGFLGAGFKPFRPSGGGMDNLKLNGVTLDRLEERKTLLKGLDGLRRDVDASGMLDGMDAFTQAAFGVLTSSRLVDALDLNKEDPEIRARYGDGKPYKYQYDGAPTVNEHLLIARRLIEAGVRSVSLSFGRWGSHGANFDLVRHHGPRIDQATSALVQDLEERGMLDDVTVVVWGEFGRTPRINKNAGRDHWPRVSCALLAGGGMQGGRIIGETDPHPDLEVGAKPKDPHSFADVHATVLTTLGIDTETEYVSKIGRPLKLSEGTPIKQLLADV